MLEIEELAFLNEDNGGRYPDELTALRSNGIDMEERDFVCPALPGDAWEATAALNLRTQVLVCAAVVRQMLQQPPNGTATSNRRVAVITAV